RTLTRTLFGASSAFSLTPSLASSDRASPAKKTMASSHAQRVSFIGPSGGEVRSELVVEPHGEVVGVLVRRVGLEVRPREEVNVTGQNGEVSRRVPDDGGRRRVPHVACAADAPAQGRPR